MPRPRRNRPPARSKRYGLSILAGLAAACGDATVPVVGFAHPTLVEVSPELFLGDVPCLDAPGAMRRYVATAYDLGPDAEGGAGGQANDEGGDGFPLPSSGPIPCRQSVGFARTVPGHRYRADIQGYDRDDLVPLAPGVPVLVDPGTGARVEPRWTGSCGKRDPVKSFRSVVRTIGDCDPLVDSETPGPANVTVAIDDVLEGRACGSNTGEIERFEVVAPSGESDGAACGESVTLGLEPGRATQRLVLRAFEAGSNDPTWGTTCLADVIAGVTTRAQCLPLASTGALEVDPIEALAALDLACSASDFAELELSVLPDLAEPRHIDPESCMRLVRFIDLKPGPVTARVTARRPGSTEPAGSVLCTGSVVPGDVVRAACAPEP